MQKYTYGKSKAACYLADIVSDKERPKIGRLISKQKELYNHTFLLYSRNPSQRDYFLVVFDLIRKMSIEKIDRLGSSQLVKDLIVNILSADWRKYNNKIRANKWSL